VFNLFMVITAHAVSTRAGSVAMFNEDPVLTYLDHHVAPGTEIYAYPYCPMYYFLSATKIQRGTISYCMATTLLPNFTA
jgi:hypothetical protein